MGMYTELVLRCCFKPDAPKFVIDTISAMCAGDSDRLPAETQGVIQSRMAWMFGSCSFYHHPDAVTKFSYNEVNKGWGLIVRCDLKNYEDEIEKFIEWATPYIDAIEDEFLGYKRYEEDDFPVLLYHPNKWVQVSS